MLEISDVALNRTRKCSSNFYCLNDGHNPRCSEDRPLCAVDYYIGKTDLVVKLSNDADCQYKANFGLRYVCTCPVRREIYERYHI